MKGLLTLLARDIRDTLPRPTRASSICRRATLILRQGVFSASIPRLRSEAIYSMSIATF